MDKVIFGKNEIPVIIALTDEEKASGLMYKHWPPPAMAFPFNEALYRKFWMANTISPLDVIFCRSGRVISVEQGEPLSLKEIGPKELCDLVVELPFGKASDLRIAKDSVVKIIYSLKTLVRKFELS